MSSEEPLSDNKKWKVRSVTRLYALQALFQMEQSKQSADTVLSEFLEHRFGAEYEGERLEKGDEDLFTQIINEAVNQQAKIDQLTDKALVEKWPLNRIDPTLRALFRAAGSELVRAKTAPRVIIVEYVDIAGAFFPSGKEASFVNAVLDHMAHETYPKGF